jgi:hypothetical protein
MKITINDHRKIYALQKSFSQMFPFLKIEFFSKPPTAGGASPKKLIVSPSKTIGQCRTVHSKGTLTILSQMTVNDLEQGFNDTFGLTIRVFRKSGDTWLATTATDMWTLEKENTTGSEMNTASEEIEAL